VAHKRSGRPTACGHRTWHRASLCMLWRATATLVRSTTGERWLADENEHPESLLDPQRVSLARFGAPTRAGRRWQWRGAELTGVCGGATTVALVVSAYMTNRGLGAVAHRGRGVDLWCAARRVAAPVRMEQCQRLGEHFRGEVELEGLHTRRNRW
jgi:hypothetical protein